jgi:hypothetical protein
MAPDRDNPPRPPEDASGALRNEPEEIRALFRGVEVYPGLSAEDFREMAKFKESPNLCGLPAHSIRRPLRGEKIREFSSPVRDLTRHKAGDPIGNLRSLFSEEPSLLLRGRLAEGSARPFCLTALVPQSHAHLAQGIDALFWPAGPVEAESFPSDLHLILWPNSAEQLILHLPASKLLISLGTDDPRAALIVVVEAAHRLWSERTRERTERETLGERIPPGWEEMRILPGGSFALHTESEGGSLVFLSETVPDGWAGALQRNFDPLMGRDARESLLAGAEPWVAEGGGLAIPFWRNPPLPASLLASVPCWRDAALHPDALPFGVKIGDRGEVELEASRDDAFVIVPRARIPQPFVCDSSPTRIRRVVTYRYAKQEAMERWARGFPAPEIL